MSTATEERTMDALVGERVMLLMFRKRITQVAMARQLGLDQSALSRKLRGERAWSVGLERVLPKPYTCHSLRHYFATAVFRGSRNLRAVQELLGHSRPETTARYTLVDEDELTAAVLSVA